MISYFLRNRKSVQDALYNQNFVRAFEEDELEIIESKAKKGDLRSLKINNIPIPSDGEQCAWEINLEDEDSPFAAPPKFKKAEKALIFFHNKRLYVFLIELKQSLQPFDKDSGISAIQQKIEDSICRISTLLPIFVFGNKNYENLSVRYYAIICYNREEITTHYKDELKKAAHEQEQLVIKHPLTNAFIKGGLQKTEANTKLGTIEKVWTYFHKNTGNPENAIIDITNVCHDLKMPDDGSIFICPHAK